MHYFDAEGFAMVTLHPYTSVPRLLALLLLLITGAILLRRRWLAAKDLHVAGAVILTGFWLWIPGYLVALNNGVPVAPTVPDHLRSYFFLIVLRVILVVITGLLGFQAARGRQPRGKHLTLAATTLALSLAATLFFWWGLD